MAIQQTVNTTVTVDTGNSNQKVGELAKGIKAAGTESSASAGKLKNVGDQAGKLASGLGAANQAASLFSASNTALGQSLASVNQVTGLVSAAVGGFFNLLKANPIGVIVTGLSLLVTAMLAFGDSTDKATDSLSELNIQLTATEANISRLQSEAEAKQQTYIASLKAQGASVQSIQAAEDDLLRIRISAANKTKTIVQGQMDQFGSLYDLENLTDEQSAKLNELNEKRNNAETQVIVANEGLRQNAYNRTADIRQKAEDKSKAAADKVEAARKAAAEAAKRLNDELIAENERVAAAMEAGDNKIEQDYAYALKALDQQYEKQKTILIAGNKDITALEQNYNDEVSKLATKKFADLEVQRQNDIAKAKAALDKKLADEKQAAIETENIKNAENETGINNQFADGIIGETERNLALESEKQRHEDALNQITLTAQEARSKAELTESQNRVANAENEAKAKLQIQQLLVNGLDALSELALSFTKKGEESQKKGLTLSKALAVASATISTYLAAQEAYRSQMSIPTPDAPVRAALAAGIAVAAGLVRVKKILSVNTSGASTTSTGGSGGGGYVAPVVGAQSNQTTLSGDSINQIVAAQQSTVPIRAYVVESDITQAQRQADSFRQSSSLG